jgi:SAM-dependent methyltransferase
MPGSVDVSAVGDKAEVREYWEAIPCGSKHASAPEGTSEYFAEVERARYELEPFIHRFADFEGSRGLHLLEIGVGLGTDFIQAVRAGAIATGIDLTERAIALTRRRLELEGLEADLQRADAEHLPFPDSCFDRVYSWGVLMVTPNTSQAIREALRVLRPGGSLCAMIYSRHSWLAYGLWLRYALLVGRPWRGVDEVIGNHIESKGMKAYTPSQLTDLFSGLDELQIDKVATPYDRRVGGPLVRLSGNRLGWFTVVRGRKRVTDGARAELVTS